VGLATVRYMAKALFGINPRWSEPNSIICSQQQNKCRLNPSCDGWAWLRFILAPRLELWPIPVWFLTNSSLWWHLLITRQALTFELVWFCFSQHLLLPSIIFTCHPPSSFFACSPILSLLLHIYFYLFTCTITVCEFHNRRLCAWLVEVMFQSHRCAPVLFVLSYSDMPSCSGHLVLRWLVYCLFGSQTGGMLLFMDLHHWVTWNLPVDCWKWYGVLRMPGDLCLVLQRFQQIMTQPRFFFPRHPK